MYTTHEPTSVAAPMSEEERDRVRLQLHRLLETHHFKNSRRYPALLRFIVEETLEGRGEYLKERLLGVRVFDRPPDYDTATDPIVRVTIAEVRKRIAQYYHDEEHDAEMRIELLPGRYAPEFRTREPKKVFEALEDPIPSSPASALISAAPADSERRRIFGWQVISFVTVIISAIGLFGYVHFLQPSALEELWAPILGSRQPILFCIPTDVGKRPGPASASEVGNTSSTIRNFDSAVGRGSTFLVHESLDENVVYSDVLATLKIADLLTLHHRSYRVRLNVATSLEDLRDGPTILIGGLDNQWTMRALTPLRFRFTGSDRERYWISDQLNPAAKEWSLDLKQPYGAVTNDYAIIARLHNQQTGQPEMVVAGIGMSGTAAAGEFISDSNQVEELRRRLGPRFKDHDFEVVLSTDVVNGMAGSAKILAVTIW
ncbi:hypothetical protein [Granulicella arctica]|uniref:hypothetical protein n=1 Tax=Granulicella arctica TaxID=940613 RepID=UPI0021E09542|nr:hypothetical protein [Granulicella arctica]